MILNHINLGVTDVAGTVNLFETYFGLRPFGDAPMNQKMAFLQDDSGALISLFKVTDAVYPKIFHIGFIQKTAEEVHTMHARLAAAGLNPDTPREEHGRLTFYFKAPGGFTIEVDAFL